jgi:hypothetical protein
MRQQRWLELIKYYDLEIHYHPGKANVVVDAFSRKSQVSVMVAHPMPYCWGPSASEGPQKHDLTVFLEYNV